MKIVRARTFFLTLTDFLRKIKRENRKPSAKGADTLQYPENVMIDRYYASWLGINAVYDKFASLYGVTSNVLCLLDFLIAQEKPVTQMEIGRFMRLPKQTIASMVNGLEKKGLAVRQIAQNDHRSRVVSLTEAGREQAEKLSTAMRQFEREAMKQLNNTECEALAEITEKLLHSMTESLEQWQPGKDRIHSDS